MTCVPGRPAAIISGAGAWTGWLTGGLTGEVGEEPELAAARGRALLTWLSGAGRGGAALGSGIGRPEVQPCARLVFLPRALQTVGAAAPHEVGFFLRCLLLSASLHICLYIILSEMNGIASKSSTRWSGGGGRMVS